MNNRKKLNNNKNKIYNNKIYNNSYRLLTQLWNNL